MDSGASEHLTYDDSLLRNVKQLEKPVSISTAKADMSLTAKKVGEILEKIIVNEKEVDIRIRNVFYVLGLEFNLLSVPKLEINGLKIIFKNGKRKILKEDRIVATVC